MHIFVGKHPYMNRFVSLILLLWIVLPSTSMAQDYIIRIYGDTISAKVDRSTERFVYYRTPDTRRGEQEIISKKEVSEILYNADPDPNDNLKAWKETRKYSLFELGIDGGYSRLFNLENPFGTDFDEYYKELSNGTYVHGSVIYRVNEELGFGVSYAHSEYSNKVEVVLVNPGGARLSGMLSNDHVLDYYAATLSYIPVEFQSGNRVQVIAGVGVMRFVSSSRVVYPFRLEATSFGAHLGVSFELALGGGFYLPLRLTVRGFNVFDVSFKPGENMPDDVRSDLEVLYGPQTGINFGRADIGAGLIFAF